MLDFAACAFLGGVLEMLLPEKRARVMRAAVASLLIYSCVSPLAGAKLPDIYPSFEDTASNTETSLDSAAAFFEKKIYTETEKILINSGVDEYEINISAKADNENNTVIIENAEVSVGEKYAGKISELKEALSDLYGCGVLVGEMKK